jgi:phage terminase small subunit
LSDKQKAWLAAYLENPNATDAARKAGYKHPESAGRENLQKPLVWAALDEARRGVAERNELSQDWVLGRLKEEAARQGDGASHAARVKALELIGKHIGMWNERDPLSSILALFPPAIALEIRAALVVVVPPGGSLPGEVSGPLPLPGPPAPDPRMDLEPVRPDPGPVADGPLALDL